MAADHQGPPRDRLDASTTLPPLGFSDANARLSDVMTTVVQHHQPRLVQRHRGKEAMLLVDVAEKLIHGRWAEPPS